MSAAPMERLTGVGERGQRDRAHLKSQRYRTGGENARLHHEGNSTLRDERLRPS
jgi:hypothetical protein